MRCRYLQSQIDDRQDYPALGLATNMNIVFPVILLLSRSRSIQMLKFRVERDVTKNLHRERLSRLKMSGTRPNPNLQLDYLSFGNTLHFIVRVERYVIVVCLAPIDLAL
jgi:hypothetical protein